MSRAPVSQTGDTPQSTHQEVQSIDTDIQGMSLIQHSLDKPWK